MRRFILGGLLVALATAVLAPAAGAEERRVDDGFYTIEEPAEPAAADPAQLAPAAGDIPAPLVPAPLAEVRQRHRIELETLTAGLAAARDQAERESLERQAMDLKLAQQREELQWLMADALARGDSAYAAQLGEALDALVPRPAPVPVTLVPRDPATGRALDSRDEGGVR
ncbi:MAG: hypothetical protein Q8O14_02060 [bacterium]|jgi:hypothetical protein|nr:hypothetical protein [bacterium]